MKKILVTSVALLSLVTAAHAAQDVQTRSNIKTEAEVGGLYGKGNAPDNTKKTLQRAEKSIKKAANQVKGETQAAQPAPALTLAAADISKENSAEYMIGKPVLGANNERVGSVHDLILAKNGNIDAVIIADGGGMSVGDKKIAIDYSALTGHNEKGEMLSSLSEEKINKAQTFAYKAEGADEDARVIAADQISMRDVLSAKLISDQNKNVAAVTDVAIENGKAASLIIAHDQFLGFGGKKASVPFSQVALTKNDKGKADFRLNAEQVAQLDSYQGTSKKQ